MACFDKAATYCEAMVNCTTSLMEPTIIAFLGLFIGGLTITIHLLILGIANAIDDSGGN